MQGGDRASKVVWMNMPTGRCHDEVRRCNDGRFCLGWIPAAVTAYAAVWRGDVGRWRVSPRLDRPRRFARDEGIRWGAAGSAAGSTPNAHSASFAANFSTQVAADCPERRRHILGGLSS